MSIKNATGRVWIRATGTIVGHVEKTSRMTVNDPNDADGPVPIVSGQDRRQPLSDTRTLYTGTDIRFKLLSGTFALWIQGSGISVSAVGKGRVCLDGVPGLGDGSYSVDEAPFKSLPAAFTCLSFGG